MGGSAPAPERGGPDAQWDRVRLTHVLRLNVVPWGSIPAPAGVDQTHYGEECASRGVERNDIRILGAGDPGPTGWTRRTMVKSAPAEVYKGTISSFGGSIPAPRGGPDVPG